MSSEEHVGDEDFWMRFLRVSCDTQPIIEPFYGDVAIYYIEGTFDLHGMSVILRHFKPKMEKLNKFLPLTDFLNLYTELS